MIRHHVYPCKKPYTPTEEDIKQYPTLQPLRVTEPEGADPTLDNPNGQMVDRANLLSPDRG